MTRSRPRLKRGRVTTENRKYRFSAEAALKKLHIFLVENIPVVEKIAIDNHDITLAPAEELELEPPARVHRMSGHRDAIAIVLSCSCGWTRKISAPTECARSRFQGA